MSAASSAQDLWALYGFDPLRNVRHRDARSARELADWLAWLELGGYAARTRDAYERAGAVLLNMFPDKAFADFTDGDLMQCLMSYPAPSRHVAKSPYSNWFAWGYKSRRIPGNPVDLLPAMKARPQKVVEVFSHADEAALCALPCPDGNLMQLLFGAGLRNAEARHLTGRRVDLEGKRVIVKDGAKGSKDRVVAMSEATIHSTASLMLLEGIGPDTFFWYDRPGGRPSHYLTPAPVRRSKAICATSFSRWWKRCLEDAQVEYKNPHVARHTYATRLRELGMELEEIQQMLGHASIRTTADQYVHTNVGRIGDKMRGLQAAKVGESA